MTRGIQTDMEERIVAALEETPGATLRQLSDAIAEVDPQRIAATLHYLSQSAKPPRIERTGETRWYRYWIAGTVPANPEPVPRDIRVGSNKGAPGRTAQLIHAVREKPGITAGELGRITEIEDSAKVLAVLVRRGQMQAVGPRLRRRYYPIGYAIPAEAIATPTPKPAATPKPKPEAGAARPPAEATRRAVQAGIAQMAERTPRDMLSFSIDGEGRVRLQRDSEAFTLGPSEVLAFYRFVTGTQPVWEGKTAC